MNKFIATILAAAAVIIPATAKKAESTLQELKVQDVSIVKQQGQLHVSCTLDFSDVEIGSNQQVIYTPLLRGNGEQITMAPVVLNGRNAQMKWDREPKRRVPGAQAVSRKKGETQMMEVSYDFPYEAWMDYCQMAVSEDLCGCGVLQDQACRDYGDPFDNTPAEAVIMTYIQPAVEGTKSRSEEGSAFVDYMVNKTNILPDYRNNRAEIKKITATIDLVKNDPLVSITEINIHGFASPEGSYSNNARLAEGRAASLKDYVKSLYTLKDNLFTSTSTPEDWTGLRRLVEASTLADKEAILGVIDSNLEPDAKDADLRKRFPQSYQIMLRDMYPALRHSDYKVKYVVRPLTIEETIEVMKVKPKNVSLQEMFLVAQTYEPGSADFNEAMRIAVETYPDDPTANLNAAAAAIAQGDFDAAERYLVKAGDTPEAQQARGVIAMNKGDFDAAERYLNAAKAAGVADADHNLSVLARTRQLAGQNK